MSAYSRYAKAIARDLGAIAIWEPATQTSLGDYGTIQNRRWLHLGHIAELIPDLDPRLLEYRETDLVLASLGDAEISSVGATVAGSATPVDASAVVNFGSNSSVFLRAEGCVSRALQRPSMLAEAIARTDKWSRQWLLVNQVADASHFQVLISVGSEKRIKVKAKSTELLNAFLGGSLSGSTGVEVHSSEVVQFIGKSGPIYMGLIALKGTTAIRRNFAEGRGRSSVKVQTITPKEFVELYVEPLGATDD